MFHQVRRGLITNRGALDAAPAGGSPTFTATDNPAIQNPAGSTNIATFLAVNLGATPGLTVICITAKGASSLSINNILVGAVSATRAVTSLAATEARISDIWYASTTNTSDNIVVTANNTFSLDFIGITVAKLTGITATPTGTTSTGYGFPNDPQNVILTVPSTGFGVGCWGGDTPNATPTLSNVTQDYNTISGTSWWTYMGHNASSGSQTMGLSGYSFSGTMQAGAAWGP